MKYLFLIRVENIVTNKLSNYEQKLTNTQNVHTAKNVYYFSSITIECSVTYKHSTVFFSVSSRNPNPTKNRNQRP